MATLKKGLMILDALLIEESMTLSELMRKFSLNKSTTFRLLYTLELMGYVEKEDQSYSVTDKVAGRANPYNAKLSWLSVSPLYQLSSEIGETVYIGILDGTDIVTTQVVDGTHSVRSHTQVGERSPAHLSALGKVILAFLGEQGRGKVINQLKLTQKTENTFVDPHLLKEHLKVIREQGYAVDDEETEIGLRCIAAPILLKDESIAAVALSGPAVRLKKNMDRSLSKRLIQCSEGISKML